MNHWKQTSNGERKKGGVKKLTALALTAALLLSGTCTASASSKAADGSKEEIVYIDLTSTGEVEKIYVVNKFTLNESGQIVDYGDYTSLRNMTTNDELKFEHETVTIDTMAKALYYEGILDSDVMPWDFSFRYFLDGVEYENPQDMAGKGGSFRLKMDITENKKCDSTFFENYAVQMTVQLDTKKCKNIEAEGATLANVGSVKQMSYTALPGSESHYEITTDVTDFEMHALSINGIPMSMEIDVDMDENDDLNDSVSEITDAVAELDDGASDLLDGAVELKDGAGDLMDGSSELNDGTGDLLSGADELVSGTRDLQSGAFSIKDGAGDLKTGADSLQSGAKSAVDGAASLKDGAQSLADGAAQVSDGANSAQAGAGTLKDGAASLKDGAASLQSGAQSAASGAANLYSGLAALSENSQSLQYGGYNVFVSLCDSASSQINAALSSAGLQMSVSLSPDTYDEQLTSLAGTLSAYRQNTDSIYATKASLDSYSQFYQGLLTYTNGVDSAASGASDLTSGLSALSTGASELYAGTVTLESGAEELYTGLVALAAGATELKTGSLELRDGVITLYDGLLTLSDGAVSLANGAATLQNGAIELNNGVGSLTDGAVALRDGVVTVSNATGELLDGAVALYDGTVELHDGVVTLKDGTLEFRDETADLEETLKDKISDAISDYMDWSFEPVSFVDKRNDTDFVQFVIKTPAIEIAEEEVEEEEPEELNAWEKFLDLFGLYKGSEE